MYKKNPQRKNCLFIYWTTIIHVHFLIFRKGYKALFLLYLLSFFTYVFTLSFPFYTTFYIFLIVYITFYLIFYFILLFFARLASPRTLRSLALLFLSLYPHIPYLFYTLIHSLFPLPFRLPFRSRSFHSHFHYCSSPLPCSSPSPVLLSLLLLSISVIHSSPLPSLSSISLFVSLIAPPPPIYTASIQHMFPRFLLPSTYSTPSLLLSPVPTFSHLISYPILRHSFVPILFSSHR